MVLDLPLIAAWARACRRSRQDRGDHCHADAPSCDSRPVNDERCRNERGRRRRGEETNSGAAIAAIWGALYLLIAVTAVAKPALAAAIEVVALR